jgi:uncharacterized membrane protein YhdT
LQYIGKEGEYLLQSLIIIFLAAWVVDLSSPQALAGLSAAPRVIKMARFVCEEVCVALFHHICLCDISQWYVSPSISSYLLWSRGDEIISLITIER